MFGAIADMLMTGVNNMYAQERQDDQQQFNSDERLYTQAFNSAEAAKQRQWQHDMSASAYQRTVHDLKLAGLNPMLAYGQGASHAGPGAAASAGMASSGAASPGGSHSIAAGMQAASQIALNDAVEARTRAEADKVKAEEQEIRERTPTHAVSIDVMRQNIQESQERIRKIIQETSTSFYSAENLKQQTTNLQEIVPKIRATVEQLRAQTRLTGAQEKQTHAQTGLTEAQHREIIQRIQANLPALEAALKNLEANARTLDMPRRTQEATVNERFIGSLGATLRALNPFSSFFNSVR